MAATLSSQPPLPEDDPPLALPEHPADRAPSESEPAAILLVDDDDASLRALQHLLEPLGQNLVCAKSGEEALRWLLREDFALILLDMRMPGLDGVQTARYINARARTRQIPIIFLTAHQDDVERVIGAYAAGAVDYVSKPFEPKLLRSKVSVFVELHRARSEHVREARARAEAEGIASTIGKLQRISDAALRHLELDDLVPELLTRAAAVFDADGGGLLLVGDGVQTLTLVSDGAVRRVEGEEELLQASELMGEALAGKPLGLPALAPDHGLPETLVGAGARSLIATPVSGLREQGALFLISTREHAFSYEDLVVLGLSAERAATAVAHARSYGRERGFVEVLQDHLLPDRLPQLPGLSLAARYKPSERLAQVGGDWYDVIQLPDGGLGVAIGDVVGHGVGAATLMAELRAALRAYAMVAPQSPARAVSALNALVAPMHRQMVATLLYVVLDDDTGGCRYASAGHLPPLVLGADGASRYITHRPAPPLGVSAHTAYLDNTFELQPAETLLLYTDGLIERRGEGIDLGFQRLQRVLRDAPADLQALCDHALRTSEDYAGPRDDIALIALRRLARTEEVLDLTLPAEPESVRTARHRLRRWLDRCGAGADLTADLLLAANEACTNAVVHAYGPQGRDTFRVTAGQQGGRVLIRVADHGSWRTPRGSEGGRGLNLIEQLVDSLDVEHTSGGTTVTMKTALEKNGGRNLDTLAAGGARIVRQDLDGIYAITADGELDIANVHVFRDAALGISNEALGLVVDLSEVTFMDSATMSALFEVRESLGRHGQVLKVVTPPGSTANRLLELTGFDRTARAEASTVDEAVAAIREQLPLGEEP